MDQQDWEDVYSRLREILSDYDKEGCVLITIGSGGCGLGFFTTGLTDEAYEKAKGLAYLLTEFVESHGKRKDTPQHDAN